MLREPVGSRGRTQGGVSIGRHGNEEYSVMKIVPTAIAVAALSCATSAAVAEPIQIYDDENYTRLARWEQHLDDRISDGVRRGSLRPTDAWRYQKRLDGIEIH